MLKSRFDGTEKNAIEKVDKLAGGRNPVAKGILNKLLFYTEPLENMYIDIIDQLGLYGNRIEMLYEMSGSDIADFVDAISYLYDKGVPQDKIIAIKLAEEMEKLF